MKPRSFSLMLAGAAVAVGLSVPPSAQALDPALFNDGFAPLTPLVTRSFLDLEPIAAGSVVTEAQHQTLVADLAALPPGGGAPSAADLDALATDFGALATAGLVDDDLEYNLAMDFDVDYPDPDPWLLDVGPEVHFALHPPPPYDPNDPGNLDGLDPVIYETLGPATVRLPRPNKLVTRLTTDLLPTYWPEGSSAHTGYGGSTRLTSLSVNGIVPVPALQVSTLGLPLGQRYAVSVIRQSDGASVRVGHFRPRGSGQPLPTPLLPTGTDLALPFIQLDSHSAVTFGGLAKRRLPDGFNVNDVASVVVSDAQGRTVLSQDFANENRANHIHRVRLTLTGKAVAEARGTALGVSKTLAGGANQSNFFLLARHLPASTPVTLTVDGTAAGQYTTTADGRLLVAQDTAPQRLTFSGKQWVANRLPLEADGANLRSVLLTDLQGNVLLSGGR